MNILNENEKSSRVRNRFLKWIAELVREFFSVLLVTYLLLILFETLFPSSVSFYINLNYLIMIVIVVGVATMLVVPSKADDTRELRLSVKSIITIVFAGISGAVIIWYKAQEIGWLSYVTSIAGGVLIVLLSILIWQRDEGVEQRPGRSAAIEAEEVAKRTTREAKDTFKSAVRKAKEKTGRQVGKLKRRWRDLQERLKTK